MVVEQSNNLSYGIQYLRIIDFIVMSYTDRLMYQKISNTKVSA